MKELATIAFAILSAAISGWFTYAASKRNSSVQEQKDEFNAHESEVIRLRRTVNELDTQVRAMNLYQYQLWSVLAQNNIAIPPPPTALGFPLPNQPAS